MGGYGEGVGSDLGLWDGRERLGEANAKFLKMRLLITYRISTSALAICHTSRPQLTRTAFVGTSPRSIAQSQVNERVGPLFVNGNRTFSLPAIRCCRLVTRSSGEGISIQAIKQFDTSGTAYVLGDVYRLRF